MSGGENSMLIDDGSTAGVTSGVSQRYLIWKLADGGIPTTNNMSIWEACIRKCAIKDRMYKSNL